MLRCQKCKTPIRVELASNLGDHTLDHFRDGLSLAVDGDVEAVTILGESFVVLEPLSSPDIAPVVKHGPSMSPLMDVGNDQRFLAMTKLLEIASNKCHLDLPLCRLCNEDLLGELNKQIESSKQDCAKYEEFLRNTKNISVHASHDADEFESPTYSEEELEIALQNLKNERSKIRQQKGKLGKEAEEISELEAKFNDQAYAFQIEIKLLSDQQSSVKRKFQVKSSQLEQLKTTNVYDDAFHIYYDGHFGTINGFRLGRLASQAVNWDEINAALGQAVLLVDTIAKRCNFTFSKYQLFPLGSYSKIGDKSADQTFELHGSDSGLGRLGWHRSLNTALVWFLTCIQEIGDYAHQIDDNFRMKYTIQDDLISEHKLSVKFQFNEEGKWTKALKYLLINLKFLLAWFAQNFGGSS